MKLTVLGGAGACPNPGQGCSSYLVESSDERLLLDCGPDTLSVLREHADYRAVTAVLISHLHADHTLDLVPYRYGLKYGPDGTGRPVPLWLPPGGRAFLHRLAQALAGDDEASSEFFESVFDVSEYDPQRGLSIGGFRVRFHPTRHYLPCWAIQVRDDDRTLAYLADTGPTTDWGNFGLHADLMVCEGTLLAQPEHVTPEQQGHLTARQAGEIARSRSARRLLLTHLWSELGNERYRAEAAAGFGGPVDLAWPGLTLSL
ncbi:MAG TPA: MBL fold metallo-hydrolase [Thermomicrobiaceae bacterium]|nr:MBL fold metallo-hydrolase [Thermomicrobiaceae bacterium]